MAIIGDRSMTIPFRVGTDPPNANEPVPLGVGKERRDILFSFWLDDEVRRCAVENFFHQWGNTGQVSAIIPSLKIGYGYTAVFAEIRAKLLCQGFYLLLPYRSILVCDVLPKKFKPALGRFEKNIGEQTACFAEAQGRGFLGE
jgi:hypothetical protein